MKGEATGPTPSSSVSVPRILYACHHGKTSLSLPTSPFSASALSCRSQADNAAKPQLFVPPSSFPESKRMSTSGQPSQPSVLPAPGKPLPIGTTVRGNPERDPFVLLTADHNAFRDLIAAWRLTNDASQKRRIALELSREVVSHASVEEQLIHPLYQKHLGGASASTTTSTSAGAGSGSGSEGLRFFEESNAADQTNINALNELEKGTKELLRLWTKKRPEDHALGATASVAAAPAVGSTSDDVEAEYQRCLARCENAMTQLATTEAEHLTAEETLYFPALNDKLSKTEKVELYERLVAAKKFAPTHPHPSRPDNPTMAKLMHPIEGAIDRAVDSVMGRK